MRIIYKKGMVSIMKNNKIIIETVAIGVLSFLVCIGVLLFNGLLSEGWAILVMNVIITLAHVIAFANEDKLWLKVISSRIGSFISFIISTFLGGKVYELCLETTEEAFLRVLLLFALLPELWLIYGLLTGSKEHYDTLKW